MGGKNTEAQSIPRKPSSCLGVVNIDLTGLGLAGLYFARKGLLHTETILLRVGWSRAAIDLNTIQGGSFLSLPPFALPFMVLALF